VRSHLRRGYGGGRFSPRQHWARRLFSSVDAACDMRRVGQACILGGRHSHGGALTERAEEHDAPSVAAATSRNMPPGKRLSPIVG